MKHLLAASAVLTLLTGTPAPAADIAVKALSPAAAVYGWTGCYIGGHAGGIWERDSTSVGIIDPAGISTAAFAAGAIPNGYGYDRNSWIAGGQLGCNYQITNWVVGIETDLSGTNLSGGQAINTAVPPFFPIASNVTQKMDWIGTTRGRLGVVTSNNILLYGTAGIAYGHVANSSFLSNVAGGGLISSFASDAAVLVGWTAGGGVEVGFGQWSVKGEALYYDLGSNRLDRSCALVSGAPCGIPDPVHPTKFENHGAIARLGLNYHFSSSPSPAKP